MKSHKEWVWLLASMYLAGLLGLGFENTRPLFQALTPFHLLTSFGILVLFQKDRPKPFYIFLIICVLAGYFVEVAGVKTGLIFGHYQYGNTLGLKISEVPPLIGINWFLLVCCTGTVMDRYLAGSGVWVKSVTGALLLSAFDYVAEPVAIHLNMWHWLDHEPPVQNYMAWFFLAFLLLYWFFKADFKKKNAVAPWLLVFQVVFFGILNIILKV